MGAADSKLLFSSAIKTLLDCEDVTSLDNSFWDQFWSLVLPLDDIFAMFPSSDIRKLGSDKLYFLVEKLVGHIEYFFTNIMVNTESLDSNPIPKASLRQLLNSIRIMTRLLPFCFEKESLHERITRLLCSSANQDVNDEKPWRGFTVALIDLLFIPGFTLPSQFSERSKIFYIVWESGIGSDHVITSYQEINLNRHDVLRLILVLLSYQMYLPSKEPELNPFAFIITSTLPEPVVLAILCSLLNMVIKYDPIGWGLPYNYYLFPDEDGSIFATATQLLNILIDYDSQRYISSQHWILSNLSHDPRSYSNIFRYYISKLYRKEDFSMLWTGILKLVMNPIQANRTYLPGSSSQIKVFSEILVLFWRLIQFNQSFFRYIMELDDSSLTDFMVSLVHYATDQEFFNLSSDGLVHLCCFILLHLSGEREFSIRLNSSYRTSFSTIRFDGTFADYLICSFIQIISLSRQRLYTIAECVLMTIVNISPFVKSLSAITCNKLVSLIERCSQPGLLYMSIHSPFPKLCSLMLEAFGYILQYQYDANSQLVYTFLRRKHVFYSISKFSFENYNSMVQSRKNTNSVTLTEDQFVSVKHELAHLSLLLDVLNSLYQDVEKLCPEDENDACDEQAILSCLQRRTLVGLIPLPKPISIRKFRMSVEIASWLTSFLYGVIYLHNQFPPIW